MGSNLSIEKAVQNDPQVSTVLGAVIFPVGGNQSSGPLHGHKLYVAKEIAPTRLSREL